MGTKQTAVDILFNEIKDSKAFLPDNLFKYLESVYEKSKQMEKEQHSETWKRGSYSLLEHGSGEDFEQYYNETYNK